MADEVLLTCEEAARRLMVGRTFLYVMIQSGELRSLKLGRSRRILATDLIEFAQRKAQEAGS